MDNQDQQAEALLQQVALSMANITYALDSILGGDETLSVVALKSGLKMIRDQTESVFERIYDYDKPVPPFVSTAVKGRVTEVLAGFEVQAA